MGLRPDQRCEAKINNETIQQPIERIVYDFEGRRRDLGPDTVERPGIIETTIDCVRCPFAATVFESEGRGPYGHINNSRRDAAEFIEKHCQKFQALKASGQIQRASREFHPDLP